MAVTIHPTAIVDKHAQLADGVEIGAYSIIGEHVTIGQETWVGSHAVIAGRTHIGSHNRIFQFCSLGGIPQDKKYRGEHSALLIGDHNTIREYCSFNIGTAVDKNQTSIGSHNWFMAYVHIAHDCVIGNQTVFANGTSLAGHVVVEDYVTLNGFTLVNQWCRVGESVYTAAGSLIRQDVLPYVRVKGNPARVYGSINKEGLRRRSISEDAIEAVDKAYKHCLYNPPFYSAEEIAALAEQHREVRYFLDFWQARKEQGENKRGIMLRCC